MNGKRGALFRGYRWVSTRGKEACPQCAERHGKIFALIPGDGEYPYFGMQKPPLHPNCRCTLVEYFEFTSGNATSREGGSEVSDYPTGAPYIRGGASDSLYKLHWKNNGRSVLNGPVYELYGGQKWTAGRNPDDITDQGPADITPADDMDACFASHDYGYDTNSEHETDKALLNELEALPEDPRLWARPPRNISYAITYRKYAIFWFKGKIGREEVRRQSPGGHNMHEGPYSLEQP